jgi:hypothetical protein
MTQGTSAGTQQDGAARAQVRTCEHGTTTQPVYVVGCNQPGYMPESGVAVFTSATDALGMLRADIDLHVESLAEALDDHAGLDAEHLAGVLPHVDSWLRDDARSDLRRCGAATFVVAAGFDSPSQVAFFVHVHDVDGIDLDADDLRDLACDGVAYLGA